MDVSCQSTLDTISFPLYLNSQIVPYIVHNTLLTHNATYKRVFSILLRHFNKTYKRFDVFRGGEHIVRNDGRNFVARLFQDFQVFDKRF